MDIVAAYRVVDRAIAALGKPVKPLYYVEPANEAGQKRAFLAGRTGNPRFTYRPLEYDPVQVEQDVRAVKIPPEHAALAALYREKVRDLLLDNAISRHRGVEDVVREATAKLHGTPGKRLVTYAEKLLANTPAAEGAKTVEPSTVRKALEGALARYGLKDWTVELSDKKLTTVYANERKITLSRDRKFAADDPVRLSVHEVGVHALRAANGYAQPLEVFATGLPGYLPTEEGMASYFEERTGTTSQEVLRDYAARVIAVDAVCRGRSFRDAYERLRSFDLSEDQSWNLAVRAYRGGGYIKDHIYLDGVMQVRRFAQDGGDFRQLYVGKVGIGHLPLVRQLLADGILRPAAHLPDFVA